MNHGKYDTPGYKAKLTASYDLRYGPKIEHKKNCKKCGDEFLWYGRRNTKAYDQFNFCSVSCRNFRGKGLDWAGTITNYRTICFSYHEKKCVCCPETKIVEVHHYDKNSFNNDPDNLIPMCPTHHQYVHSQHAYLVEGEIDTFRNEFIKKTLGP